MLVSTCLQNSKPAQRSSPVGQAHFGRGLWVLLVLQNPVLVPSLLLVAQIARRCSQPLRCARAPIQWPRPPPGQPPSWGFWMSGWRNDGAPRGLQVVWSGRRRRELSGPGGGSAGLDFGQIYGRSRQQASASVHNPNTSLTALGLPMYAREETQERVQGVEIAVPSGEFRDICPAERLTACCFQAVHRRLAVHQ